MLSRVLTRTVWRLVLLAAAAGCYHEYVAVAKPDPMPQAVSKTVYSYAWGLVHSRDTVAVCPRTNAIDQIEVRSNFGQTMLGILTLGIVVPRRVIWHCSRPREPVTDIGLAIPPEPGR
jgi:hypothetical protein